MSATRKPSNRPAKPWIYAAVPAMLIIVVFGVWQLSKYPTLNTGTHNVVITLQRDACYGSCPTYMLTVTGDGKVDFQPTAGPFAEMDETPGPVASHTQISEAAMHELIGAFQTSGFFAMNDEYSKYDVTDMPSATTTITIDGRTKSVRHYYGDNNAPEELTDLESKIDEIAGTNRWLSGK